MAISSFSFLLIVFDLDFIWQIQIFEDALYHLYTFRLHLVDEHLVYKLNCFLWVEVFLVQKELTFLQ